MNLSAEEAFAKEPTEPPILPATGANTNDTLRNQMRALLGAVLTPPVRHDRRLEKRQPYPKLVRLTPVLGADSTPAADPITVVGMEISAGGIGFYHQQPIPYRRAILELNDASGNRVSLLVRLDWCRFTCEGWYVSGGRFLEVVVPPRIVPCSATLTTGNRKTPA
jgi:hypothetical protein